MNTTNLKELSFLNSLKKSIILAKKGNSFVSYHSSYERPLDSQITLEILEDRIDFLKSDIISNFDYNQPLNQRQADLLIKLIKDKNFVENSNNPRYIRESVFISKISTDFEHLAENKNISLEIIYEQQRLLLEQLKNPVFISMLSQELSKIPNINLIDSLNKIQNDINNYNYTVNFDNHNNAFLSFDFLTHKIQFPVLKEQNHEVSLETIQIQLINKSFNFNLDKRNSLRNKYNSNIIFNKKEEESEQLNIANPFYSLENQIVEIIEISYGNMNVNLTNENIEGKIQEKLLAILTAANPPENNILAIQAKNTLKNIIKENPEHIAGLSLEFKELVEDLIDIIQEPLTTYEDEEDTNSIRGQKILTLAEKRQKILPIPGITEGPNRKLGIGHHY